MSQPDEVRAKAQDELWTAIRSVGRAADQDPARAEVIKRATALDSSDMIPDGWNSDGSLAEEKGSVWTAEQRDTANDVFAALSGAINDAFESGDYGYYWVGVQDWYGTGEDDYPYTVIYYYSGDIWATTFTIDADSKYVVDIENARKVRPCTSYIDRAAPKTENRALPKSVEWRQQRAEAMKGMERRLRFERFDIRSNDDGTLHFTGYASVTNTPYEMGWYSESISRGAFKKTLNENPDVVLLLNHTGLPMARTKGGTLTLDEDDIGCKVDADLDPDDPDSQVLARKMKRGDLDGQMSFAFRATRQSWNEDWTERTITEVDIHRGDVSVVTQGANPNTFSSIRTDDALAALRHAGPIGVLESLLDLRRYASLPKEQRIVASLSPATQEMLTQFLNLSSSVDDALDEAKPILTQLLGADNPGEDATAPTVDETPAAEATTTDDDDAARSAAIILEARRQLESLRYPGRDAA